MYYKEFGRYKRSVTPFITWEALPLLQLKDSYRLQVNMLAYWIFKTLKGEAGYKVLRDASFGYILHRDANEV